MPNKRSTQAKTTRPSRAVPTPAPEPTTDTDGALKGSYLIDAIAHEAVNQGVNINDLYERFGFQETYWKAIINGNRSISNAAQARLELIAEFLNRPLIQVLNLAEVLEPRHFFAPGTIDDDLNLVFKTMLEDRHWSTFVMPPERWDALDRDAKILITLLYQEATNRNLKAQFAVAEVTREPARPPVRAKATKATAAVSAKGGKVSKKTADRARSAPAEAATA